MSKKFIKILTICSLVLVIPAIVVASAICLSTAYAVKVSVDTFIDNDVYGLSTAPEISINSEVASSVQVQKGKKVQITFSTEGINADFVKICEGNKEESVGAQALDVTVDGKRATYVVESVKNDMHFTVVYEAPDFHKVKVTSNPESANITVGAKGADVYDFTSTYPNTYIAKHDTIVELTQSAKENDQFRYTFTGWTQTEGQNELKNTEGVYTFVAQNDAAFTANFTQVGVNTITLNAEFTDGQVNGGSYEFEVTGADVRVLNNNTWTVTENGAANVSVKNVKGYKFVGWFKNGQSVQENAMNFQVSNITESIVYTAKFEAIKFEQGKITFNYHGNQSTTNSSAVKYGSLLADVAPEVPDYYENGWHKFIGWKLNGTGDIITTATFDSTENISLTAAYWDQSAVTYKLAVPAVTHIANGGTITYKVGADIAADGCAALREFYVVKGIKVGETAYDFKDLGTMAFADAKNFEQALANLTTDLNATEVNVNAELVWEWSFASLTIKVEGNLEDQVSFERNQDHADALDLEIDLIDFLNENELGTYNKELVQDVFVTVTGTTTEDIYIPVDRAITLADVLYQLEGSLKDQNITLTFKVV